MATKTIGRNELDLTSSRKTLLVLWRNPTSNRFAKVGQVDALPDGHVAFQYLDSAWKDPDFSPLIEYPDRNAAYVSNELPAFFANRVLSAGRPGYARYLDWLGVDRLNAQDVPFEVLARTGGGRVTDTFHVVELPLNESQGFSSRFFVSGLRHTPGVEGHLLSLKTGDHMQLQLEERNPVNPRAVLVNTSDGEKIGYIPDWLCSDVRDLLTESWVLTATVERVNPDAPAHVRLLCRIDASRR